MASSSQSSQPSRKRAQRPDGCVESGDPKRQTKACTRFEDTYSLIQKGEDKLALLERDASEWMDTVREWERTKRDKELEFRRREREDCIAPFIEALTDPNVVLKTLTLSERIFGDPMRRRHCWAYEALFHRVLQHLCELDPSVHRVNTLQIQPRTPADIKHLTEVARSPNCPRRMVVDSRGVWIQPNRVDRLYSQFFDALRTQGRIECLSLDQTDIGASALLALDKLLNETQSLISLGVCESQLPRLLFNGIETSMNKLRRIEVMPDSLDMDANLGPADRMEIQNAIPHCIKSLPMLEKVSMFVDPTRQAVRLRQYSAYDIAARHGLAAAILAASKRATPLRPFALGMWGPRPCDAILNGNFCFPVLDLATEMALANPHFYPITMGFDYQPLNNALTARIPLSRRALVVCLKHDLDVSALPPEMLRIERAALDSDLFALSLAPDETK